MNPFANEKKRKATSRVPAPQVVLTLLLMASGALLASAQGLAPRQETSPSDIRARDAWRLETGKPFEREIAAGETHSYTLSLAAGQLVRLAVETQRATLVLTLFGPGGEKLEGFDLQGGSPVPYPVAFVNESAGGYRLEVSSPKNSPPGRYALGVEELRAADPKDRGRVEAERAFADGAVLQFAQGGAASLRAAIAKYERARSLWQAAGDRADEARALGAVGTAHVSLGEHREAVGQYLKKLEIVRELKDARQDAFMSEEIGRLYYSPLGDKARALAHLDGALALYRELGRQEGEARTLTFIGKVYAGLGSTPDERQKSFGYFLKALGIQRTLKNRYYEGDTFGNLMFAWKAMGRPRQAIFFGKKAVNLFQEIRAGITDMEEATQKTFIKSKEEIYRALISLLIEEGRLSEARQVLGMLKEEEYSEFMHRAVNEPPPVARRATATAEEADLEKRSAEPSEKLIAISKEYGDLRRKEGRTPEEDRRLASLESDWARSAEAFVKFMGKLEGEIGGTDYGARVIRQIEDSGGMMEDLGELGPGVVALYTVVSKEKYYVILVTPDGQTAFEHKITSAELNDKIFHFREMLQDKNSDPLPLAQKLYEIIVGPVAKGLEVAGATTLMWSFDSVLRYVPVAALHDGERYLVERYSNVIFTPATLSHLKDKSKGSWKGVGFGVSKKHGNFDPLPGVPDELRGIFKPEAPETAEVAAPAAPTVRAEPGPVEGIIPGRVYLDEPFTEDSLRAMLRQRYPVVHIASHFTFSPGDGSKSFLLLGDGQPLSLARIKSSLTFSGVELLTLSACDTATGGEGSGKEVESFAMLAQRRSAKAIVATLWPVADASTQLLMIDFYRVRNGPPEHTKAEALRQAQLALLRGGNGAGGAGGDRGLNMKGVGVKKGVGEKAPFKHPYFWAPFLLIGNWR
jgi:CHAT domain-containing protein